MKDHRTSRKVKLPRSKRRFASADFPDVALNPPRLRAAAFMAAAAAAKAWGLIFVIPIVRHFSLTVRSQGDRL